MCAEGDAQIQASKQASSVERVCDLCSTHSLARVSVLYHRAVWQARNLLLHTTARDVGVQQSLLPTPALLEVCTSHAGRAAYNASSRACLQETLRGRSPSPNALMEALHLQPFAEKGARLAAAAAESTAEQEAAAASARRAFRTARRDALAGSRQARAAALQRNEAVHAALLRHKVCGRAAWTWPSVCKMKHTDGGMLVAQCASMNLSPSPFHNAPTN